MNFVFLMMKGSTILSVECVDLQNNELTLEQAAAEFAAKSEATSYAVLGESLDVTWLLQQTKKINRRG